MTFETSSLILSLAVRIRKFTGFPSDSPETSPYFEHPLHKSDQYSISFSFIPKTDIRGSDLVFGNDFDRPIRDRLPIGFSKAFQIVKWFIDPASKGTSMATTHTLRASIEQLEHSTDQAIGYVVMYIYWLSIYSASPPQGVHPKPTWQHQPHPVSWLQTRSG